MNPSSSFTVNTNMIFVLVAGLIIMSMVMSRKNRITQRSNFGYWIGLGALLLITSGFFSFMQMRRSGNTEVRHTGRLILPDIKEEMRAGIENAKDAIKQGLNELGSNVEDARKAVASKFTGDKSSKPTPVKVALPLYPVSWTVEVKGNEALKPKKKTSTTGTAPVSSLNEPTEDDRSQSKELVEKLLYSKAIRSVNRWVDERMPSQMALQVVTNHTWLSERGAFPEDPDFQKTEVARLNTSSTDSLYAGSLKVVLSPALQQELLEIGYDQLDSVLKSHHFQAQWIITIILLGLTGLAALVGLIKKTVSQIVG